MRDWFFHASAERVQKKDGEEQRTYGLEILARGGETMHNGLADRANSQRGDVFA
jgi:hypothetical protein